MAVIYKIPVSQVTEILKKINSMKYRGRYILSLFKFKKQRKGEREREESMRYKNGNPKKSSRFICLNCLQENKIGDGIQRRGKQRENNHVKDLWCLYCEGSKKCLEVRFCDDFIEKMEIARKIKSKYYPEENTDVRKDG